MGVIVAANMMQFKPATVLYSKVKRVLKSFNNNNLIDEGDFPVYIQEVLSQLGIGAYQEKQAILPICDFKALLPKDFKILYSAYKCTPGFDFQHDILRPQQGFVFYTDKTKETILKSGNCELHYEGPCNGDKVFEKLTVREFIKDSTFSGNGTVGGNFNGFTNSGRFNEYSFINPMLLRLSPNVKKDKCVAECPNINWSSPFEITIDEGYIFTNFKDDHIFMKYYAFPLDEETGLPLVPDLNAIEKALENYIIWQLMLQWYWNDEIPNAIQKAREAERLYNEHFREALYELKLPSFSTLVDYTRVTRNLLSTYRQTDTFGYWQRF